MVTHHPVRSGIYTFDSAVCQAAIHAGILTDTGGAFMLNHEEGQESYAGKAPAGDAAQPVAVCHNVFATMCLPRRWPVAGC